MEDNKRKRLSSIDDDNHEVSNNIKRKMKIKMKMKMKMMNRMRLSTILFSCIKVALDFVSPENVGECIRLSKEIRLLPPGHQAKEDKLEVKKMVLYAINEALKDLGHNME
ncbi:hypothetical protein ACFE04_028359 [Oxalis oulophora]